MRKITAKIVGAFNRGESAKLRNTESKHYQYCEGSNHVTALLLYGNRIAWKENGELWVTTAGWDTATTKERLNAIYGVHITTKRGQMFLNGRAWNGQAVSMDDWVTQ